MVDVPWCLVPVQCTVMCIVTGTVQTDGTHLYNKEVVLFLVLFLDPGTCIGNHI